MMSYLTGSWALGVVILFVLVAHSPNAIGQTPGPGVGFRNDLKVPVIIQGVSLVNNMQRRGQPFLVQPGKTVWDNSLPMGVRSYTIYEASQQRILLRAQVIRIQSVDQF